MRQGLIIAAAIVSLPVAAADAGVVTYFCSGYTTNLTPTPPFGIEVVQGQGFLGDFSFDTTAPDLSPSPSEGLYASFTIPHFSIDWGVASAVATEGCLISVRPGIEGGPDQLEILAIVGISVNGTLQRTAELRMGFLDWTGTALDSDALPPSTLRIENFQERWGSLRDTVTDDRVEFRVMWLEGVPSPGALAVAALSAPMMAHRRRRRT